jgi:hypothetical protein
LHARNWRFAAPGAASKPKIYLLCLRAEQPNIGIEQPGHFAKTRRVIDTNITGTVYAASEFGEKGQPTQPSKDGWRDRAHYSVVVCHLLVRAGLRAAPATLLSLVVWLIVAYSLLAVAGGQI